MKSIIVNLILIVIICSCTKIIVPDPVGRVESFLRGDFSKIDSVAIEFSEEAEIEKTVSDSLIEVSIINISTGANKEFKVKLFDRFVLKYIGSSKFDVVDSETQNLSMALMPVNMFSPPECRESGIFNDNSEDGYYNLSWNRYEDSLEFKEELKLSYVLVMDLAPIADEFDNKKRIFETNDYSVTNLRKKIEKAEGEKAFFRLFLFSRVYNSYIYDCGDLQVR